MAKSHAQTILLDLLLGQATASALAERIPLEPDAITVICEHHRASGHLDSLTISNCLTAWFLTDSGREHAASLTAKKIPHA